MNSLECCSERDQSHRKKYDQKDEKENDACRSGAHGFPKRRDAKKSHRHVAFRTQDGSVTKKKGPGVQTLHKTHRACLRVDKGRSALCQEDTPSDPLHGESFLAGSGASSWKGSHGSHVTLRFMFSGSHVRRHQLPTQEKLLLAVNQLAALLSLRKATRGPCVPSLPCMNKATLWSDTRRPWAPQKWTAGVGTQVACDGVDR